MPAEMAWYVENETNLRLVSPVGGDLDLIRRLLSLASRAGERGVFPRPDRRSELDGSLLVVTELR